MGGEESGDRTVNGEGTSSDKNKKRRSNVEVSIVASPTRTATPGFDSKKDATGKKQTGFPA